MNGNGWYQDLSYHIWFGSQILKRKMKRY